MICRNCRTSFPDNYNACPRCHTPVTYQQPVYNKPVYNQSATGYSATANSQNNNQQHKTNIAIIIGIASIVLALIICITAVSITNSNNETSKYEALLQSYTNDPIVDIQELDFDNDNETEAYIITGKRTNDSFEDADIWFIDKYDRVHPVKQTVLVKPAKIIHTPNNHPYVTYEIYSPDNSTHSTYVYGVQDSSCYEPSVSGKFFDLYLDGNNRLIGHSVSDNKNVEFDINDAFEIIKSYSDEYNINLPDINSVLPKSSDKTTERTVEKYIKKATTTTTTTKKAQTNSNGWKAAYKEYLENEISNHNTAGVFIVDDIDGNGIPELILNHGGIHADNAVLLTYSNSKVCEVFTGGGYGELTYVKGAGYISIANVVNFTGYSYKIVYKMIGTSTKEVFNGSITMTEPPEYKVGEKTVSKSEYENQLNKFTNGGSWISLCENGNKISQENINKYLG